MKLLAKLNIIVLVCALGCGCAQKQKHASLHGEMDVIAQTNMGTDSFSRQQERYRHLLPTTMERKSNERLMRTAHSALGTPYVRGGDNPSGFDCSGFVQWTYKSVGVKLPRTAREQSVVGQRINRVEDMVAGDIVTFRHPKRGYHTGIYVGDGKFIHSPRKRTRVRINDLSDAYFSSTFTGARRVSLQGGENLVAQAESRLAEEKVISSSQRKGKTLKSKKLDKSSTKRLVVASSSRDTKGKRTKDAKVGTRKTSRTVFASVSRGNKSSTKQNMERSKRGKSKTSASNDVSKKSSKKTSSSRG